MNRRTLDEAGELTLMSEMQMADLDDDTQTDELDDGEFDVMDDTDLLVADAPKAAKKGYDGDLRRMIEERLEARMMRDELGIYDDELGY